MKPRNNTEVRKAYLKFSCYLTGCVILAVVYLPVSLKRPVRK